MQETLELSNDPEPSETSAAPVSFDPQQLEAIDKCCDTSIRAWPVTGPAGTGKTTIIKEVVRRLTDGGLRVVICTFMGKASKRVQEATGYTSLTIHRLLEYPHPGERDKNTGKALLTTEPKRHKFNPIEYDVVIVDEYAVVGHELHRNLMDAMPQGALLRVFGDVNQLKPVEKYNLDIPSPFQALLKSFVGTNLTTIHRQGEGSGILQNANLILRKVLPVRRPDFDIVFTENPVKVLEETVLRAMDNGISFGSLDNQVIVPGHKSWVGDHSLNAVLQPCFTESSKQDYKLPRHTWDEKERRFIYLRKGDKIVNKQNNYDLQLFNGEVGIVMEITEYGEIVTDFGDRIVSIPPVMVIENEARVATIYPQKDLYLAYALTTHSTQGSEYENIIYVLNKGNIYVQERANFYTAVTRAKKFVKILTDQRSISYSVSANESAMARKKP